MMGSDYRILDCCKNCSNVFELKHYEGPSEYYCHRDGSLRPNCGQCENGESWSYRPREKDLRENDNEKYERLSFRSFCRYAKLWDEWAEPRKVEGEGYCRFHVEQKG